MQNIIVGIIVTIAAFFFLRSLVRIITGRSKGCSCGSSCDSCGSAPLPQQDIPPLTVPDKHKDIESKPTAHGTQKKK